LYKTNDFEDEMESDDYTRRRNRYKAMKGRINNTDNPFYLLQNVK